MEKGRVSGSQKSEVQDPKIFKIADSKFRDFPIFFS